MITRHLPRILIPLALLLAPTLAHAAVTTAVDFDLGAPTLSTRKLPGYAAALGARVGYRFDLGPVWIQPEGGASYTSFKDLPMTAGLDVPRFIAGARLGLALSPLVQPSLYGHGGVGWFGHAAPGGTGTVGLAIDVMPARHFSFGAQVGYSGLATGPIAPGPCTPEPHLPCPAPMSSSIQWIAAGVHGGFAF